MKKILSLAVYIKPYWLKATFSILCNLLSGIFSAFSIFSLMPFFDILFSSQQVVANRPDSILKIKEYLIYISSSIYNEYGQYKSLLIVVVAIAFFSLLRNAFAYLAQYLQAPVRSYMLRDIRNKLYEKVLQLPLSYFTNERKGDLMSRMTSDVQEIETSVISSIEMVFRDPLLIIIYLVMLLSLSVQLTIFILIMLPLSAIIIGRIGRSLRKQSFKSQNKLGSMLALIEETLSGLRIIKAFNAEKPVNKRFRDMNQEFSQLNKRINRRRSLASPVSEFLFTVVMLSIFYYGAVMILNKSINMQPSGLITFVSMFYLILEPSKRLSSAWYNIQKGLASAERIDFILKAENKIKEKKDAIHKNNFESTIEYCNVSFKYDQQYVLQNIDLKIEKGKTVALVGQSGSGKSTLVDLLPRFYDLEHGEILIDGINIKDYKLKDLRGMMGIVNQEPILFNDTFFNNIVFGRENSTIGEVESAAKVAHAHEFISTTKHQYEHNIGDRGGKLSGGQRQRVSIARAVLNNPPILILDEATSALDTESERLVQDALTNLMQHRTTIVIAHRLSTVIHADEICVLLEGKIVERGKHEDLLALNGHYKKLHDLQMFVTE
jgi:ABC-type multidrug transport system fused ATPase/permease subunit